MICSHVLNRGGQRVVSPADRLGWRGGGYGDGARALARHHATWPGRPDGQLLERIEGFAVGGDSTESGLAFKVRRHDMNHRSFTLECTPDTFQVRGSATNGLRTIPATPREVTRCKRLWLDVGAGFWTERSRWDDARWLRHLQRPTVSFLVALVSDEDAGSFELTVFARGVRIEGFGLLPSYRGRGLGRDLLNAATERAFATGARKVWLHTATDDHPNALQNYLSGGYHIVRERALRKPMPTRAASASGEAARGA